jgi:hypothetical protein
MTMRLTSILAILGTMLCLGASGAFAADKSGQEVKKESLRYLQDLRVENSKRLRDVDETLRRRVEDGGNLEGDVSSLKATQREHRLRQDFLDRLINQIDAHFSGGDLRAFLEPALKEMAKVDAVSSDSGLYIFMRYASEAVHKLPEQKENILGFLEGYMSRSVSHPVPPKEFLATRNYTNGSQSESGSPIARDKVGDVADRRLQELGNAEPVVTPPPAVVTTPAPQTR